jgi:hypothetical protein
LISVLERSIEPKTKEKQEMIPQALETQLHRLEEGENKSTDELALNRS